MEARTPTLRKIEEICPAALGNLVTRAGLALFEGAEAAEGLRATWQTRGLEPVDIDALFDTALTEELR